MPARLELLRDNPVLRLELKRYGRRVATVLLLVLCLWLPVALLRRTLMMYPALLAGGWAREALIELLNFIIRPDMLLGFFLVHQALAHRRWRSILPELRTTFIQPGTIIAGKLFAPLVLLFALNVISAPYRYGDLVFDRGLWFYPKGFPIAAGGMVAAFALLEDVLFLLALLLIAANAYMSRRDELMATILALLQVFGLGVVITVCGFAPVMIPFNWYRVVRFDLGIMDMTAHTVFFALVIPVEWLVIRYYIRRIGERLDQDLGPEEDGGVLS
ncbi:hypothetical protein KQI84_17530 [bacterium]|nr:hypothetical protein [bacterium]